MGRCDQFNCEGDSRLPYQCNRCGGTFCSTHRLPENHNCSGIKQMGNWGQKAKSVPTTSANESKSLRLLFAVVVLVGSVYGISVLSSSGKLIPADGSSDSGNNSSLLPAVKLPEVNFSSDSSDKRTAGVNETYVERLVHKQINEYRTAAGLEPLEYNSELAEIAEYHSNNMAKDEDIYHTSPAGQTREDRYSQFGFDCRVPAGGNTFYTGGENVAKTWYRESIEGGIFYSTPEELAAGIAKQWYNSPGHRENMLKSFWRQEGIGVAISWEDGKMAVYVTQNFC